MSTLVASGYDDRPYRSPPVFQTIDCKFRGIAGYSNRYVSDVLGDIVNAKRNRCALGITRKKGALLNLEWLSGVGVEGSEVNFSCDKEDHGFHGVESGVSARLSFGGLEQPEGNMG